MRHSTSISLTNVINIITVNVLLCSSSSAAHTSHDVLYTLNICLKLSIGHKLYSIFPLFGTSERFPLHGHIFVCLNPHWIITNALWWWRSTVSTPTGDVTAGEM